MTEILNAVKNIWNLFCAFLLVIFVVFFAVVLIISTIVRVLDSPIQAGLSIIFVCMVVFVCYCSINGFDTIIEWRKKRDNEI